MASLEPRIGQCLGGAEQGWAVGCTLALLGTRGHGGGQWQDLLLQMPWGQQMALLPWGLTDIYRGRGMSPRRTLSQHVPTLLHDTPHLLPSPAASFGEPPFPSNASSVRPAPASATSPLTATPLWGWGLQKGQTCLVVLPGRGDAGTREAASGCSQPAPALSPARGGQRPGSPTVLRSCGVCSRGAREQRAPAVPSLPALSPSLPAFFSSPPPQHLPEERTGRRKHNFPL